MDIRTMFLKKTLKVSVIKDNNTMTEVASILCISRPTLYELMREHNISTAKFAQFSYEQFLLQLRSKQSMWDAQWTFAFQGHYGAEKAVKGVNQKG